jgi:hypothetical protein
MDLTHHRCFDSECRAREDCPLWRTRNDPDVTYRSNTLRRNWECRDSLCMHSREMQGLPTEEIMTPNTTPGPWRCDEPHLTFPAIKGADGVIALVQSSPPHVPFVADIEERRRADALLIAASPDLLTICQELADSADYWSEYDVPIGIVDRLRAAIATATGQPWRPSDD